jgi:hypothetical protein
MTHVVPPCVHPPVHARGQDPPGGGSEDPQPPEDALEAVDDEVVDDDVVVEDEVVDDDVVVEDAGVVDDGDDDMPEVVVPPAPASLASGRSWAPRMETHAGAARAGTRSAMAASVPRLLTRTPPSRTGSLPRRRRPASGGHGPPRRALAS